MDVGRLVTIQCVGRTGLSCWPAGGTLSNLYERLAGVNNPNWEAGRTGAACIPCNPTPFLRG
jgi:hypothetical protein